MQEQQEDKAQSIAKQILEGESEKDIESKVSMIKWDNVATLFSLGNDLMWIQDMMYRGALPERVLQGVHNAEKYSEDLGFDDKLFPIQQLTLCKIFLKPFSGITKITPELQQHYRTVNQYVTNVKWYISALLEQQQPGFEKRRAL